MSLPQYIVPRGTKNGRPVGPINSTPTKSTSITSIEIRTDLSAFYRLVHVFMRPLRPHLVGIKPLNQTGSPQISKHPNSHYGVNISERIVQIPSTSAFPLTQIDPATNTQKVWLYDLIPASVSDGKESQWWTHSVYFFAGGGFIAPPSAEHWKLTARLAKDLHPHKIRIVMFSYPLAPKSPAKDSLPLLRAWLAHHLASTNETVTLMGDSAGGNVVLSLAFWWSDHLSTLLKTHSPTDDTTNEEIRNWKRLTHIFTMSPPTDFRNTNPEIRKADKQDPVLTEAVTGAASDAWCTGWIPPSPLPNISECDPLDRDWIFQSGGTYMPAKSDPILSVNLHSKEDWEKLANSGITLDGLIGGADRLAPDGRLFMGRCLDTGVRGAWLYWEGQMHCFPLTICYGIREGREGYEWMRRRLERVVTEV